VSDRELKVTDRRMFTPEGELRDEYKELADAAAAAPTAAPSPPAEPAPAAHPEPPVAEPPPAAPPPPEESTSGPTLEFPSTPGVYGEPSFYDLLALLAEPVALYLGDAELPDGGSAENLDMARLHIDLLDVLRRKTAGNLSAQESATMDDLLYRLRMRYVQKRG
jgi:Domain of unknown function (DUF1844)